MSVARISGRGCSHAAEPQTTKPAEACLVWKQRHSICGVTTTICRTKPGQCDTDQGQSVGVECMSSGNQHSEASRDPAHCRNRSEAAQPFPRHFPERFRLRKCKGPLTGGPSYLLVERRRILEPQTEMYLAALQINDLSEPLRNSKRESWTFVANNRMDVQVLQA